MQEHEEEKELSWETARVIFGRLIGINKNENEVTIEIKNEEGELLEEDYELLEDLAKDQFEELLDYLDSDVRVILLDSTVIKIARGGRLR